MKALKLLKHPTLVILCLLLLLTVVVIASSLPAGVSAQSGRSSDREIAAAVCQDNPDAQVSPVTWEECIERTVRSLNRQCDFSPHSEAWASCRQQFLDSNVASSGSGISTTQLNADCSEQPLTPDNCGIIGYIRIITDGLTVIVGIVVVMMLIVGGIQYSSAGSNPQAVTAAKKRISQALFALVIYIFLFAFLQWIVPGGVF